MVREVVRYRLGSRKNQTATAALLDRHSDALSAAGVQALARVEPQAQQAKILRSAHVALNDFPELVAHRPNPSRQPPKGCRKALLRQFEQLHSAILEHDFLCFEQAPDFRLTVHDLAFDRHLELSFV